MLLGFRDERIELLPERAVYLSAYRILVIADLHLGKSTHFRKEGIMMPAINGNSDINLIEQLCHQHDVAEVLFLGDLFHSGFNSEWFLLEEMLHRNKHLRFILTKGNHDILPEYIFNDAQILLAESFVAGDLLFTHHPLKSVAEGTLNIAGHIHPGCIIKAGARQRFRFPCFYYAQNVLLVPAFGNLTGLYIMEKEKNARIFPIVAGDVFEQK